MKIGELAHRVGLSVHTIRYYERIGLLPYASRGHSRHREYDASILVWIGFLHRLRTTGMPIREMVRYAELRAQGSATEAERRDLLEQHRDRVRAHVAELQACLTALDTKIAGYAGGSTKVETGNDAPGSGTTPGEYPVRARRAGAR